MSTRITPGLAGIPPQVDVLVIGLGVTGAGAALDAASRGLTVLAVDAHDLAFGTSRWSSKLVHGGLRYLAKGQVGIARESAVERGILMEYVAPHLVHALPMLIPFTGATTPAQAALARAGIRSGDLLRAAARTSRRTLPAPRRLSAEQVHALAPGVRTDVRGGILGYDGQLEDDARLVVAIARTAAAEGAEVRTRARVLSTTGTAAVLRDELTGQEHPVTARVVINASGVWAADLVDEIRLKPSRGSHLVVRAESLPGLEAAISVPVPGESNRWVFALPQPDGTVYIGLTDEEVDEIPDVPTAPEEDVDFLLRVLNASLAQPLTRADIVGTYAGLRPLLAAGGNTSDLSRKHAVLVSRTGVVTVVGGKLTTYRRMAQDAVDKALSVAGLEARPCRTTRLPLLGAAPPAVLTRVDAPARLVRRFGTEAPAVLANAIEVSGLTADELLAPAGAQVPVCLAELIWGVTHEGAADADDLLDRRTRVGLVPADRAVAEPLAARALAIVNA